MSLVVSDSNMPLPAKTYIDVTYTDPVHGVVHVEVHCPPGGGGAGLQVVVNDYYHGSVVRYCDGWKAFVELGILNQDDVDAILDLAEQAERDEG
jgi:hypothetical protein